MEYSAGEGIIHLQIRLHLLVSWNTVACATSGHADEHVRPPLVLIGFLDGNLTADGGLPTWSWQGGGRRILNDVPEPGWEWV